jgi:hypothetical protein
VSPRKKIPAATEAALWTLSNGRCYAPGCPFPVIYEIRPRVYRKNAQVAHIYGVRPGAPRYDKKLPPEERDAFTNLLLLCLPHHGEVDDKKTGERNYPPETLRKWKQDHEGNNGPALAMLGAIDEDLLTELLVDVFTPPVERLQAIADQLEKTGTINANTVNELRQVVDVLASNPGGPDASTVAALTDAAEVFSTRSFTRATESLQASAEILGSTNLYRTAKALSDAAQQAITASEYMR